MEDKEGEQLRSVNPYSLSLHFTPMMHSRSLPSSRHAASTLGSSCQFWCLAGTCAANAWYMPSTTRSLRVPTVRASATHLCAYAAGLMPATIGPQCAAYSTRRCLWVGLIAEGLVGVARACSDVERGTAIA